MKMEITYTKKVQKKKLVTFGRSLSLTLWLMKELVIRRKSLNFY